MAQYICSVCGYVHDEAKDGKWETLPDDWKCPICKAGKDAFKPKEAASPEPEKTTEKPHSVPEPAPLEPFPWFPRNCRPSSRNRKTLWKPSVA